MKRLFALLLALLLAGAALAEEGGGYAVSAPVEERVQEVDAFDLGEAADAAVAPAPEAEPALQVEPAPRQEAPTVIRVKKAAKKKVWLGTAYRIEVPGKTVRSFKSGAKKIATVDRDGVLTLKKPGTVKITIVLSKKKRFVLTLKVADPAVPEKVAIREGKKATLRVGEALALTAAVSPATASQAVKWKSSRKSVAVVDANGSVKAIGAGKAKIAAVAENGVKGVITVTVKRPARGASAHYMISHAMGGIDDRNYSNCLEAFLQNYDEGHRVFEVDMEYTSDGALVIWHSWRKQFCSKYDSGYRPTYRQFMGSKIFDKYTPMDVPALLRLMRDYPDVTLITDTKYTDVPTISKQFTTIVGAARKLGLEGVLGRMVVEIYSPEMFWAIEEIHHFNGYLFTAYQEYSKSSIRKKLRSIAAFCSENGVGMVAMPVDWWRSEYMDVLADFGLQAGLYTTNSKSKAKKLFRDGVTALWTDTLPPV